MAKTIFNMADGILTPCNVACGSGIVTVNSPGGSTLQCDTWLWDDMLLNLPKRPPYCNSTSGSDFDHITAVDMSFCTSLRNFIQMGPPSAEKNKRPANRKFPFETNLESNRRIVVYSFNVKFLLIAIYDRCADSSKILRDRY